MTPDKFVKDAVRTESRIDYVNVNHEAFTALAKAIIALGNVLDAMKKNTFYGKPFDKNTIGAYFQRARESIEDLEARHWHGFGLADNYDIRAARVNTRIFHSVVGVVTEAVELLEAINLDNEEVDDVNLREEFGDLAWYIAIGLDETNSSFEQVLEKVIAKLKARYPDKFTSDNAINRDLVKERAILEGKCVNSPEDSGNTDIIEEISRRGLEAYEKFGEQLTKDLNDTFVYLDETGAPCKRCGGLGSLFNIMSTSDHIPCPDCNPTT